jgi:hypothetical protein
MAIHFPDTSICCLSSLFSGRQGLQATFAAIRLKLLDE